MVNANTERSQLWRELKTLDWAPAKPFVSYSLEELRAELEMFSTPQQVPAPAQNVWPGIVQEAIASTKLDGETQSLPPLVLPEPEQASAPSSQAAPAPAIGAPGPKPQPVAPVAGPDPNELPGQRTNTQGDDPIRTDEMGRVWYQEEVKKPSYPKPRGRRVLRYQESGVEQVTVQNGEYTETFEIAGSGPGTAAEVKITLPSYQVGIYKDPRFPFKIHCYNGTEGFDLFEVEQYWGGSELIPSTVKRVYVENHLCYDIRSVVRTIQAEHRQLQLTGRI